jgi:hypothetical protein
MRWQMDDVSTETNATMSIDKELVAEWLESLDCPFKVRVRDRHCNPEPLILTSYVITETNDMYIIELRSEDAERLAEWLGGGG